MIKELTVNDDTIHHLTEEQGHAAVAKFDEADIMPPHSLSEMIGQHPSPNAGQIGLATELLVSIFRTAGMLHKAQEPLFRKHNIVSAGWRTLGVLYFHPQHALPLHEISRMLAVTRPHITGVIDALEQDGLVERMTHPDDRRITLARLTDKGMQRLMEVSPGYNAFVAALFSLFSEQEQEQLLAMLYRLRQHIAGSNVANSCFNEEANPATSEEVNPSGAA